jgi:hypothetical protein
MSGGMTTVVKFVSPTVEGFALNPKLAANSEVESRRDPNASCHFSRAGASIIAAASEGAQFAIATRASMRSSLSPARRRWRMATTLPIRIGLRWR